MSRLYAGSLGTLGALVTLNFKTLPMPELQRAAISSLPEGTRDRAVAHLRTLSFEPTAALLVRGFGEVDGSDGMDGRLVLLFEGSDAAVVHAVRDLRSALGAAGVPATTLVDRAAQDVLQRAIDAYVAPLGERSVTYRVVGPASDAHLCGTRIAELARDHTLICETICDLQTGDVVARVSSENLGTLELVVVPFDDALHALLERVTILSSPAGLSGRLDAWGAPPATIETMRRLKARFDPRATLAPGRFVGGI